MAVAVVDRRLGSRTGKRTSGAWVGRRGLPRVDKMAVAGVSAGRELIGGFNTQAAGAATDWAGAEQVANFGVGSAACMYEYGYG